MSENSYKSKKTILSDEEKLSASRDLRSSIAEASKNARTIFFAQLAFCSYALLTLAGADDITFLKKAPNIHLPFVGIDLPPDHFFLVGPALVLIISVYLNFYLSHIRKLLDELATMDEPSEGWPSYIYPWLFNLSMGACRKGRNKFNFWSCMVGISIWILPVFTNFYFLWKYSAKQNDLVIFQAVILLASALVFMIPKFGIQEKTKWKKIPVPLIVFIVIVYCIILIYGQLFHVYSLIQYTQRNLKVASAQLCEYPTLSEINHNYDHYEKLFPNLLPQQRREKIKTDLSKGCKLANRKLAFADFSRADLRKINLSQADLTGANLIEANLQDATLTHVIFQNADLRKSQLQKAILGHANLQKADLRDADLNEAHLDHAILQNTDLRGVNLRQAILSAANFKDADMTNAILIKADMTDAWFENTNMSFAFFNEAILFMANLKNAELCNTNLQGAYLRQANLEQANLKNCRLQKAVLREAFLQRANLQEAGLWMADLTKAQLNYATMQNADLRESDCRGADLTGADLNQAFLSGIILQDARLENARLQGVDMTDAHCRRASFSGADLKGANLYLADLQETDLRGAVLRGARLAKADLKGSKYDNSTRFPDDFDPIKAEMILVKQE